MRNARLTSALITSHKKFALSLAIAAATGVFTQSASAGIANWNSASGTSWSTPANWSGGTGAGGIAGSADSVIFDNSLVSIPTTIGLDAGQAASSLQFGSSTGTALGAFTLEANSTAVATARTLTLTTGNITMDASVTGTVTVGGNSGTNGVLTLASGATGFQVVNNNTTKTLNIAAVISGATKTLSLNSAGGTIQLSGADSATGAASVGNTTSGTLVQLNNIAALSSFAGTTISSGSAVDMNGLALTSTAFTLNGSGISGGGALLNSTGTATDAGAITVASNATIKNLGTAMTLSGAIGLGANALTIDGTGSTTLGAGVISGVGGSLIKIGTGSLTLSGANTFTGGLDIKNGSVIAGVSNATTVSGAAGPSGNAITLGDSAGGSASLLSGAFTVANNINLGTSSVGTLTLGNTGTTAAAIFSGAVGLNSNALTIAESGTTGSTTISGGITGSGNLTLSDASTTTGVITLSTTAINNTGTINNSGSGSGTVTISAGVGSNVTGITESSNTSALTVSGALTPGTALTSTGTTALFTVSGGISGSGNVTLKANSTGAITVSTGAVNNSGTITNSGSGAGLTTISAIIGSNVAGVIENSATSQLTLSAANTYVGGLTIKNGTLSGTSAPGALGAPQNVITLGDSSTAVTGATLLGDTRTFSQAIIVSAAAGSNTLTIGNSGNTTPVFSGPMTLNNNLTLSAGGTGDVNLLSVITGSANITTNAASGAYVTLSSAGDPNWTGGLIVNSGLFKSTASTAPLSGLNTVTINSTGTFDTNGLTETIGGINGSAGGILTGSNSASKTLTLNGSGTYTFAGVITAATATTLLNVALTGSGSQTLTGANTNLGATTITNGTLTVGAGGSLNGTTGTALTFAGTGSFTVNESAGSTQGMGALAFTAGDGTVTSIYGGSGASILTFASLAARTAGATSNFITNGGTNGTTNKIVLTAAPTVGALIDRGIFFKGASYATYNAGGYLSAYTASSDANGVSAGGGATLGTVVATSNVFLTGNITAQTTASTNTINDQGNYNIVLASAQTLSFNGFLKDGNSAGGATISGGTAVKSAASGAELVIRTDGSSDALTISTPIVNNGGNALTKSGLGTLTLGGADTYTGTTTVNGGLLLLNATGSILNSPTINILGGTLQMGVNNQLDTSGTVSVSSGTLDLQTFTDTVSTLSTLALNGSIIGSGKLILGGGTAVTTATGTNDVISAGLQLSTGALATRTFALTNPADKLTISGALTEGTFSASLTKTGAGILILSGANSYTGATTVSAGVLQLSGANGAMGLSSSPISISGATFQIDNTTAAGGNNNNRIADTQAIALGSTGAFIYKGSDASASTETVGAITASTGNNGITVTFGGTNAATLTAASFIHTAGQTTTLINGVNLGANSGSTSVGKFLLTATPTLVGTTAALSSGDGTDGNGAGAAKNTVIVPYLVGDASSLAAGKGTASGIASTFLTYNAATGLRPLNLTDEFDNWSGAVTPTTGDNIFIGNNATTSTTAAINSLVISSPTNPALTIAAGTLTITSGALLVNANSTVSVAGPGTLDFGSAEAEITLLVNSTISAPITFEGGALTKSGAGNLTASGLVTITGNLTISDPSPGTIGLTGGLASTGAANLILNATSTGAITLGTAGTINNTGTVTNSGTGSATTLISAVIGSNVTGVTESSPTSPLTLSGTNTFIGPVTSTGSGALLQISSDANLGNAANGIFLVNGAKLSINGVFPLGATRTISLNNGGILTDPTNGQAQYNVGGNIVGTGGLTLNGNGSTFVQSLAVLSGNNTYSGGTSYANDQIVINSENNIGGSANLSSALNVTGLLSIIGTQFTSFGTHVLSISPNGGGGIDLQEPTALFNLNVVFPNPSANNGGAVLTKSGLGTLVVTAAQTYSNGGSGINTEVNGGVFKVDASAGGSLASGGGGLQLGGGTFYLLGKGGALATTQTLATKVVLSAGNGTIVVDNNGGSNSTTLNLALLTGSTATESAGSTLNLTTANVGTGSSVITTTSLNTALTAGIISSRILYNSADWATLTTAVTNNIISAYTGYTAIVAAAAPTGTDTNNTLLTNTSGATGVVTPSASWTTNTLKIASGTSLNLGANTVTLTAGGLLYTGAGAFAINGSSGALASGTATASDLIIQQYGAGALTINAVIANGVGASTLTKSGSGQLILTASNTYTGATYVNGGLLTISNNNQLGAVATGATLNLNGGTLQTISNSITLDNSGANKRGVVLGGNGGTFDVASGTTLTVTGAITGYVYNDPFGRLTLTDSDGGAGNGTLVLSGNNTFAGGVVINGGILQLNNPGAIHAGGLNTVGFGSASLEKMQLNSNSVTIAGLTSASPNAVIENANATAASLTVYNGGDDTFAGTLQDGSGAGALSLAKGGGADLNLTGSNTFTGFTNILNGTLTIGSANALTSTFTSTTANGTINNITFGAISDTVATTGGTLQYTASSAADDFSARLKNSSAPIAIDTNSQNVAFASIIDSSNIGGFTKLGAGTLTTTAANTFTGTTLISAGTLQLGDGATLNGSVAGNITNNATLAFANPLAQSYTGVVSGSGAVNKFGAGVLSLSGTNLYSGATSVTAGTLALTAAGSINTTTGVTLNGSTAKFLNNSSVAYTAPLTVTQGTIGGSGVMSPVGGVSIGSSAIISPGNSPAAQSYTTGVTFASGGTYKWEINNATGSAGTNYDQLDITGGLAVTATSGSPFTIDINSLTALNAPGSVPNFSNTGYFAWKIASTDGITGYAANDFTLQTTNFVNSITNGAFAIHLGSDSVSGITLDGSANDLYLTYAPTITATTFTLAASPSTLNILKGGKLTGSSTITNTGTGAADSLDYTGLSGTTGNGAVATVAGSSSSPPSLANGGGNSSQTLTINGVNYGSTTITSSVASATNHTIGGSATFNGPAGAINVLVGNATAYSKSTTDSVTFGTPLSSNVSSLSDLNGVASTVLTGTYSGPGTGAAALGTNATLLQSTLNTVVPTSVSMAWRTRTAAETLGNPAASGFALYSDAVNVGFTGSVPEYILEMSWSFSVPSTNAWIGEFVSGAWQTAGTSNVGSISNPTVLASEAVGSYGYDATNGELFVVLNQGGTFGVIPEPASLSLLAVGAIGLLRRRRRS